MKKSFLLSVLVTASASGTTLAMPDSEYAGTPTEFRAKVGNVAAVWQDEGGLHLRTTTDGKAHRFSGKVCAKEAVSDLKNFQLEAGDKAWVGPQGKCVWFKFWTQGLVDGVDFNARGNVVIFDLKLDDAQLAPAQILIGASNKHPAHSPFLLQR